MKYTAAIIAAAVGANAWNTTNTTVTTEIVDQYVTYCPGPTQITQGSKVYNVTKATTLTITDCPCTVTRPVVVTPVVICHTCNGGNYPNTTATATGTSSSGSGAVPVVTPTKSQPTVVPTAGAGKAAALSGAGLAGIVGLAAFVL